MIRKRRLTVLRSGLRADSDLHESVSDGLSAVLDGHRDYFDVIIRPDFDDSLDLDQAMAAAYPQQNKWDYLLGHRPTGEIVAVEPHSAKQDQVSTVIRKRTAAKQQLQPHLRNGVVVARWLWVASGNVQFANPEKTTFQLAQNGIEFVGRRVLAKHLGQPRTEPTRPRRRRRRR